MRIGCFVMTRRSRNAVKTLRVSRVVVSTTVRAVLFLSMLVLLGGDVEVNPGSPKSQKQKTLSFADVSVTEASSPQLSAQVSNSPVLSSITRSTIYLFIYLFIYPPNGRLNYIYVHVYQYEEEKKKHPHTHTSTRTHNWVKITDFRSVTSL